ncbi:hypothetical protein E2C01_025334 [Portunus trituberculatus]|uniref:Uncharacterized protein n=1 Tax=Portunus trituberculatus TaxID=210409 RepID=A0A5B7ED31_PORTR|nr:hypothetical protein [Portunus trituberculatus]
MPSPVRGEAAVLFPSFLTPASIIPCCFHPSPGFPLSSSIPVPPSQLSLEPKFQTCEENCSITHGKKFDDERPVNDFWCIMRRSRRIIYILVVSDKRKDATNSSEKVKRTSHSCEGGAGASCFSVPHLPQHRNISLSKSTSSTNAPPRPMRHLRFQFATRQATRKRPAEDARRRGKEYSKSDFSRNS